MSNVNEKVDPTVDEKTGKTGQADTTITPVSASELAQSGTLHTVAPESTGHHSFYNDASITFEEYNFWANRSRDFEKHIPTSGAGIQGLFNTIIGRRGESSVVTTLERPIPVDASEHLPGGDKWGLTEMEWETAQRAARTATWGMRSLPHWPSLPLPKLVCLSVCLLSLTLDSSLPLRFRLLSHHH